MLNVNGTNTTLNQLIGVFKEIADVHAQIQDFGHGDNPDIFVTTRKYPLFWVQFDSALFGTNTIQFNTRLIFMDLVNTGQSNELEIQSDAITIL